MSRSDVNSDDGRARVDILLLNQVIHVQIRVSSIFFVVSPSSRAHLASTSFHSMTFQSFWSEFWAISGRKSLRRLSLAVYYAICLVPNRVEPRAGFPNLFSAEPLRMGSNPLEPLAKPFPHIAEPLRNPDSLPAHARHFLFNLAII